VSARNNQNRESDCEQIFADGHNEVLDVELSYQPASYLITNKGSDNCTCSTEQCSSN